MENMAPKYKVFNPKNENCTVCAVLNSIYRSDSFQIETEIPKQFGKGYYQRIIVKPSMEINISDVTFFERMTMVGGQGNPQYCFAFCLGDQFRWRLEGNKEEYEIECGENYIFSGNQVKSICSFNPGQRFWGVSIQLDSEVIKSLIHYMEKEHSCTGLLGSSIFYKRKFSYNIKRILNDISHCPYRDNIKRIYLEGKILELIGVYMDELIFEKGSRHSSVKLSSSDMEALHKARRVLDENIISPPTIGELARLVCLNEYKLKNGFKGLFGMPVHAYVIDKRLEMARFLLEYKKLGVTEAVLHVGYNDASHFAEKFRKKYGFNPSEYTKSL
ncbi:transcriptional regulator, AraC family [Desulfofarcimen acetoxidans DSM 771]|jgi:AraC-like DNA-binding protein|uniref:Transcriptional regulator, AraC family n=1 Tax=Desulfofarcimen acetoxidans (strain ATCC 49208 / DSM 771 / KCTC 5769 / VKM B-1644 / 5575) TaxID=485916 RepID=C8W166_DESAS|nr:AraC family transcriptional regulator [Desulfofarcimen acetoxidans]ACV63462.1 transcriptional regulator, AraC family [Desulfofarcimen acetoxidans DSM 771]